MRRGIKRRYASCACTENAVRVLVTVVVESHPVRSASTDLLSAQPELVLIAVLSELVLRARLGHVSSDGSSYFAVRVH